MCYIFPILKTVFKKQSHSQGTALKSMLYQFSRMFCGWNSEPSSTSVHFQKTHKLNAQNSQVKLLSCMLWKLIVCLPNVWKMSHSQNSLGWWLFVTTFCFLSEALKQKGKKENELFYIFFKEDVYYSLWILNVYLCLTKVINIHLKMATWQKNNW